MCSHRIDSTVPHLLGRELLPLVSLQVRPPRFEERSRSPSPTDFRGPSRELVPERVGVQSYKVRRAAFERVPYLERDSRESMTGRVYSPLGESAARTSVRVVPRSPSNSSKEGRSCVNCAFAVVTDRSRGRLATAGAELRAHCAMPFSMSASRSATGMSVVRPTLERRSVPSLMSL